MSRHKLRKTEKLVNVCGIWYEEVYKQKSSSGTYPIFCCATKTCVTCVVSQVQVSLWMFFVTVR